MVSLREYKIFYVTDKYKEDFVVCAVWWSLDVKDFESIDNHESGVSVKYWIA